MAEPEGPRNGVVAAIPAAFIAYVGIGWIAGLGVSRCDQHDDASGCWFYTLLQLANVPLAVTVAGLATAALFLQRRSLVIALVAMGVLWAVLGWVGILIPLL